jgi:hypothetical protein
VLRYREPAICRDLFLWQGKRNLYDDRLAGFFSQVGNTAPEKQKLDDWVRLWGPTIEQDAVQQESPKTGLTLDAPQLDRLVPPRIEGTPAGADLVRLGIIAGKKKN